MTHFKRYVLRLLSFVITATNPSYSRSLDWDIWSEISRSNYFRFVFLSWLLLQLLPGATDSPFTFCFSFCVSNAISRKNCCSQTADGWSYFVNGIRALPVNWIIYLYSTRKLKLVKSLCFYKIPSSRNVEERLTQNFQLGKVRHREIS
jgi:hypothetical protein